MKNSKGRPPKSPPTAITIIFATSKNSNAQTKSKTIRNRSIDELLECNYVIPGIPEQAIIKEVLIGSSPDFINPYLKKHGLLPISK